MIALMSSKDLPEENLQCTDIARSGYRIRHSFDNLQSEIINYYRSVKSHFVMRKPRECPACSECPDCPRCKDCPACPTCLPCPACPICPTCPEAGSQLDSSICDCSNEQYSISHLQEQINLLEQQLSQKDLTIKNLEGMKSSLELQIQQEKVNSDSLQRQITSLETSYSSLQKELRQSKDLVEELRHSQNKEELTRMQRILNEKKTLLIEKDSMMISKDDEIAKLKEELNEKAGVIENAMNMNQRQREEIDKADKLILSTKAQMEDLVGRATECEQNLLTQKTLTQQKEDMITIIKQEMNEKETVLSMKVIALENAKKEIEQMNSHLLSLENDLNEMKKRNAQLLEVSQQCDDSLKVEKNIVERLVDSVLYEKSMDLMKECEDEHKEDVSENPSMYDNAIITCLLDKHNNQLIEVQGKPSTMNYAIVILSTLVVAFLLVAGFKFCVKVETNEDFIQYYSSVFSNKQMNTFLYPFQLKERQHSQDHQALLIV